MTRAIPTTAQLNMRKLMEEHNRRCAYCGVEVHRRLGGPHSDYEATIDHIIPRCKGGTDDYENLILACRYCNELKGGRDVSEFIARREILVIHFRPRYVAKVKREHMPRPEKKRRVTAKPEKIHPAYKVRAGSMAWAVEQGIVREDGLRYVRQ